MTRDELAMAWQRARDRVEVLRTKTCTDALKRAEDAERAAWNALLMADVWKRNEREPT